MRSAHVVVVAVDFTTVFGYLAQTKRHIGATGTENGGKVGTVSDTTFYHKRRH